MATNDFRLTRDQIITSALRKLGAVDAGGTPTASQISDGAEALNVLVKSWQNLGVRLWSVTWEVQALTSGVYQYILNPILDIQKAFVRRDDTDYPVEVITMQNYFSEPSKDDVGLAQRVAFKPDILLPEIYVWPVPDNSTDELHTLQVRKLYDFDASGDYADFQSRWMQALIWSLAAELAPEYGVPVEIQDRLVSRGTGYLEQAIRGERALGPTDDFIRSAY